MLCVRTPPAISDIIAPKFRSLPSRASGMRMPTTSPYVISPSLLSLSSLPFSSAPSQLCLARKVSSLLMIATSNLSPTIPKISGVRRNWMEHIRVPSQKASLVLKPA